jgi:hypothetical protein
VQGRKAESGRLSSVCRTRANRWRACLLIALLACGSGGARAEDRALAGSPGGSPAVLMLDIPAQPLATALDAFSRATGLAVLVDQELTRGRRSVGINGRYSATAGLGTLLTGSGLMARYVRADAFTLQTAQVDSATERKGSDKANTQAVGSYALAIQKAIEQTLCHNALTRPGTFRAALQVWIGGDGMIEHSRLLGSSGDSARDEALVLSLRRVRLSREAPSSLRQPVTLLLLPDSTGKRMECTEQQEGALGA